MSTFSTLVNAEIAKLQAISKLQGITIIAEDTGDLATEIAKQIAETGMVVLIGIPSFKNESEFTSHVTADIDQQILIREFPAINRDTANALHCQDVAQMVAQSLQGLIVQGFQILRVINGVPLGNIRPDKEKEISFQDYRLDLKTRLSLQPITN